MPFSATRWVHLGGRRPRRVAKERAGREEVTIRGHLEERFTPLSRRADVTAFVSSTTKRNVCQVKWKSERRANVSRMQN